MADALFQDGGGEVSFETFMNFALHHPQHGYYARSISNVGSKGDFTTTAEISPALAKAVASWATGEMKRTGCRHLIELGPGSGHLAESVWEHLPMLTRWRTTLHLVESSQPLRRIQQARKALRKVQWHNTVEDALHACGGHACLYSNEFFDAFPARVFQRQTNEWQELFLVRMTETRQIHEVFRPVDPLPDSTLWQHPFAEKQRVEVLASVHDWLDRLFRHWHQGSMLTIDYGDVVQRLYHRRPHGSLRGYLAQQRIEGPGLYQNIGRQDLTCDVNFSDLEHWSEQHVDNSVLQSQGEFLQSYAKPGHAGDQAAIHPLGAGEAFKVWTCRRKIESSQS